MTLQEQQMIDELVDRIRNTQLPDKDADADQRLKQGLASYPDAIYVLAQTVLVQQYGLDQAQQQIQAMQDELDRIQQQQQAPPQKSGSFLGNLLGMNSGPQQPPPYQPANNYGSPGYPPQGPPMYAQPGGWGAPAPAGGGFLRGALQTAAGVAAGEMMFEGMESLFHGFGGGGGYGQPGFGEGHPTEVINNNYYGEGNEHEHRAEGGDSSFYNPSNDASRENFADDRDDSKSTGDNSSDDFANVYDDNSGSDGYDSGDDGGSGGGDDGGF
jgi:hypothetical protein